MAKEFPEEDEVLIGTVEKLTGTSVFVKLEEYNKEGVISFSEVAAGRIRNLRDYVQPGRRIVCKVLRVDTSSGNIDLSLRRVSVREKKEVLEAHAREKETIVMLGLAVKEKNRLNALVLAIKEKIGLPKLLEIASSRDISALTALGLSSEEANAFMTRVAEKAKQKMVTVKNEIVLSSEAEDGLERIKKVLAVNVDVKYISAPRYLITIQDKDYKEANKKLKEITDAIAAKAKETGCTFEIKTNLKK